MNQNEFLNFSTSLGIFTMMESSKQKQAKSMDGKVLEIDWSKLRHIRFEKPSGNEIIMQYKYNLSIPFQAAIIGVIPRRGKSKSSLNLDNPLQYDGLLPVSVALKKDLVKLCEVNAIDPQFHEFYYNLKTTEEVNFDDVDPNRDTDAEYDSDKNNIMH